MKLSHVARSRSGSGSPARMFGARTRVRATANLRASAPGFRSQAWCTMSPESDLLGAPYRHRSGASKGLKWIAKTPSE